MSRTLTNLAVLATLAVRSPLAKLGLFRPKCAWRRATGFNLRSQGSKFTLSAFGLNSGFDGLTLAVARSRLHQRLNAFLESEPSVNLRVVERAGCCVGVQQREKQSLSYTFLVDRRPDESARFQPPNLFSPGWHEVDAVLNIDFHLSSDLRTVDVWMQFHHAVVDGAPMQELISRLEQAWGTRETVLYPAPGGNAVSHPWHRPGDRALYHVCDFLDFTPLLELRRRLSATTPTTVAALLVWHLSRQRGFEDKRFASTVDVPATSSQPRCVDFVVIRPADFANLAEFTRQFDMQIEACRSRQSESSRATRALALLPGKLALAALKHNPQRTSDTFGTVGLSILRDAKVFVAPMADVGFDNGLMTIGSMNLPTADGQRVGSVSIKGDAGKPEALWAALNNALAQITAESAEAPPR